MSLSTKGPSKGPSSLFATASRSANQDDDFKQYHKHTKWRPLSSASCRVCDKPITEEVRRTSNLCIVYGINVREDNVSSIGTRGINYTVEHYNCQTLERLKNLTLPDETTFEQKLEECITVEFPQQTEPSPSELTEALEKTDAGLTGDWEYLGRGIHSLHLLARSPTGESSYTLADGTHNIRAERLATILFRAVAAVQNSEPVIQRHSALKESSRCEMETYIANIFRVSLF